MYTDEHIDSAVKAGIMTVATAESLKQHVAQFQSNQSPDEEHFKLVTGFNDIFVVIASLLLLTAITWIFFRISPWFGATISAATTWGLSEFFIRKRKMALPAIVLLLAFVINSSIVILPFATIGLHGIQPSNDTPYFLAAGLTGAIAAWLHWKRFKVPITPAAGVTVLLSYIFMTLSTNSVTRPWLLTLFFIAGLAVFATALWWDAADTERKTRKSDVAFWLHLLAAPLLVHPIFTMLDVLSVHISGSQAVVVFLLYLLIGFVSLMIDRRALMVSALAYVLYTFSSLLKTLGVVNLSFAITALAIGAGLLMLSAFWHRCRHYVLRFTPPALKPYLPK